jgi:hypothetical protein
MLDWCKGINIQEETAMNNSTSERIKKQMVGYAHLNKLTLHEKQIRLPNLTVEESLRQFLELESFAEATGSLTRLALFSKRSLRHILTRREAFRRLAEHA